MQQALKLAVVDSPNGLKLVDPRQLEISKSSLDPKHLEYKELTKSTQGVARAGLSLDIRELLDAPSLPNDIKVKLYRQTLDRFLKLGNVINPSENKPIVVNYEQQPVVTREAEGELEYVVPQKKKKEKKLLDSAAAAIASVLTPTPSVRQSSRSRKQKKLSPSWVAW